MMDQKNNTQLALQIIVLIETIAPEAIALIKAALNQGMTVQQYLDDAKAKDADAIAAAQKEIAADQGGTPTS